MDYVLSPSDLPKLMEYTAAEETEKVEAGGKLEKIVPFKGEPRFPSLTKLMRGLLTIPASNADSTLFIKSFYNISSHDNAV